MVDFKKALIAFKKYLEDYDLNDSKINLKVIHTYGVVYFSEYICRDLKLSSEDKELAKLIALLHDIARFEQLKQYGAYEDYKTFDHADLGAKILFEDNLIRKFIDNNKYDNIIYKAIKNHNKLNIESGLNDEELLHSKIVRDADKTDNFRVAVVDSFEAILNSTREKLENDIITDKIYNDFMNNRIIINHERKTDIDSWIAGIAFIYDYNFNSGLKYIKDKKYIDLAIDRLDYKVPDTKEKMQKVKKYANDYLNKKLSN